MYVFLLCNFMNRTSICQNSARNVMKQSLRFKAKLSTVTNINIKVILSKIFILLSSEPGLACHTHSQPVCWSAESGTSLSPVCLLVLVSHVHLIIHTCFVFLSFPTYTQPELVLLVLQCSFSIMPFGVCGLLFVCVHLQQNRLKQSAWQCVEDTDQVDLIS